MAEADIRPEVNQESVNITVTEKKDKPRRIVLLDPSDPDYKKRDNPPRRVLHFSDGILEEYSETDEDEEEEEVPVNTKELSWGKWMWHYTKTGAKKSLAAADYCGEKLAWALGITSPKYQYAIDEYHRQQKEAAEEAKREAEELEFEKQRRQAAAAAGETNLGFSCGEGPETTVIPDEKGDAQLQQNKTIEENV